MNSILQLWREKLLDLSKSNKLIQYRDNKLTTAQVIFHDADTVYNKLKGGNRQEVFDMDGFVERQFGTTRFNLFDMLNKLQIHEPKSSQLVLYNGNDGVGVRRCLKELNRKTKSVLAETGINVLYVALGFVNWFEKSAPNSIFKAPLLLVPVKLINDSAVKPFYIHSYEEEVVLNPTFQYKLSTEFKLDLTEPNEDETLSGYLQRVRQLLKPLNWTVSDEIKLGMFSFLKMNMYLDLKINEDLILQQPAARTLLGFKAIEQKKTKKTGMEPVTDDTAHCVVDADSSQMEAVLRAKSGESFVLQGPPGTGKSQTITNIIAECLHDGKSVLFVSEKLAALQVVHNNLKRVNLDDFCLELHSHKTNKKEVIQALNESLRKNGVNLAQQASEELVQLELAKEQLDRYAQELQRQVDGLGITLFELYNRYMAENGVPDIDFTIESAQTKDIKYLAAALDILGKYTAYTETIGYDYMYNEWYGYRHANNNFSHKSKLKEAFSSILVTYYDLKNLQDEIYFKFLIEADTINQFNLLKDFMSYAAHEELIPGLFRKSDFPLIVEELTALYDTSTAFASYKQILNEVFSDDIFDIDGGLWHAKFRLEYDGFFDRMKKVYKTDAAELRRYQKNPSTKIGYQKLRNLLYVLQEAQRLKSELGKCEQSAQQYLGESWKGEQTDWERVFTQIKFIENFIQENVDVFLLSESDTESLRDMKTEFSEMAERISQMLQSDFAGLDFVQQCFDPAAYDLKDEQFSVIIYKTEKCLENIDNSDNWLRFDTLLKQSEKYGIRGFLDAAIVQCLPVGDFEKAFKKLFYKQWINYVIANNEVLSAFSRAEQDHAQEFFCQKDKLQFDIAKAKIHAQLSDARPRIDAVAGGSQVSLLIREGEKKRKLMPVRVLMQNIPELARALKPCFLMSPLSVSTYLDSNRIFFDTVIFDEASQIFPEDALGAIYRAKQVIVVGDSQQMPPTNFFTAMSNDDDTEDDFYTESVKDFESVLDICAVRFRQQRLKWHYRSRMEDLIAFSNKHFYNDELVTFPSAKQKEPNYGVDFCHIPDGVFDRKKKNNRREAEYVADLVCKHFDEFPERSLGVVAFSQSQQDLIEDILNARAEKNPALDKNMRKKCDEPFFVKNLETVQGDERDTIIFSVGYAKDESGKFIHNFGPLNRQGGERRLNVAVTRAKINVKLVASITQSDIDIRRTEAVGARLLKSYLAYAQNLETETAAGMSGTNAFAEGVRGYLNSEGFDADIGYGHSASKIDIAVKHPSQNSYVLAVECDGSSYYSNPFTRDRDRLRREVLQRLGWKHYRIWSTELMKNPEEEYKRLKSAVETALEKEPEAKYAAEAAAASAAYLDFIEEKKLLIPDFAVYQFADTEKLISVYKNNNDFPALIHGILKIESPISEEWLLKRIAPAFGRERLTAASRDAYAKLMRGVKGVKRTDGFLFLENQREYNFRVIPEGGETRDIKQISLQELANGMYAVVKLNIEINKDTLFQIISERLGYRRIGEVTALRLESALELMKKHGLVIIKGQNVIVKEYA